MPGTDTICAVATPPGEAGVAVVRISGANALSIGERVVRRTLIPRRADYVSFFDTEGEAFDQGLVLFFPKPHSFTGEDVVELHTHSNTYLQKNTLSILCRHGARLARPGEFSERAFANHKLDLAQLEAVVDLIQSGSERAARSAARSMRGVFSRQISRLLEQLIAMRVHVEAYLDFPEEEIDTASRQELANQFEQILAQLGQLEGTAKQGMRLRNGATIALAGAPNVGKSSLLNALSQEDRAIVTPIAGTTRDLLTVDIEIEGLPVQMIDTAGIRDTDDPVEIQGVARAENVLKEADLIIWLLDASEPQFPRVELKTPTLMVYNKIDLLTEEERNAISSDYLTTSVKENIGLAGLREVLGETLGVSAMSETPFSARARHVQALDNAGENIQRAKQLLLSEQPLELVAEELRIAQQYLGEITGEFSTEDLLGRIFGEFCIGK